MSPELGGEKKTDCIIIQCMVVQYILSEPMRLWALIFVLKLVVLNLDAVGDPQFFFRSLCIWTGKNSQSEKEAGGLFNYSSCPSYNTKSHFPKYDHDSY